MKDANKQTILHSAARAGHIAIIDYVINESLSSYVGGGGGNNNNQTSYRGAIDGPPPPSHFINFYDRWFRSAVHWATLNGRVQALKLLLDHGCNPAPGKRKTNKYTSLVTETPLEICKRLYGGTDKGNEMEEILMTAILVHSKEKASFKVKNLNLEINNNMN
jgi:ankyrin repeat protein